MSMSQAERVAERLRDDIVTGARSPGDRLVERDLADDLGVSRVPVREALRALVAEGLVVPRPRSWAVVREFTERDLADLVEVREALELMTFRLAAERRTAAEAADLTTIAAAGLAAAGRQDATAARRLSAEFHERAVKVAGNRLLAEVEQQLRGRLRWLYGQHDDLLTIATEHARLAEAVAAGDVAALPALVTSHLATGHRLALERLRNRHDRPMVSSDTSAATSYEEGDRWRTTTS